MDRFRGSAPARLDEKGRLKVPGHFRQQLEDGYGPELFITSLHGNEVRLYPMQVWRGIEEKLAAKAEFNRAKAKFVERVNYFGQSGALDKQGRVLIPQILRDAAKLPPDVVVTGSIDFLIVSDRGALASKLAREEFGAEDYDELSKLLS